MNKETCPVCGTVNPVTGGRLGGFLTGALKVLYYWLAQAVWFLTFGRVYAGSSLIVTAKK